MLLLDADVLDAVLHAWLAALVPPPPVPAALRAVAVDGKTCRTPTELADLILGLWAIEDIQCHIGADPDLSVGPWRLEAEGRRYRAPQSMHCVMQPTSASQPRVGASDHAVSAR